VASTAAGRSRDPQLLTIEISLPREGFFRGRAAPVLDLDVQIKLTNNSDKIALTFPQPKMDPLGLLAFEMHMLGMPTGEKAKPGAPQKTRILRSPPITPVDDLPQTPEVTLAPKESKQFIVDIGGWFAVKAAGKYEITCQFQDVRSNTIQFEVFPLKRVDVPAHLLLGNIADYERGKPAFPFMFYITRGPGRYDAVIYLTRHGKGGYEHYEPRWLGQIAPDKMPQMKTKGAKVALVVPDKRNARVSWKYLIDFGTRPIIVKGDKVVHEPGAAPAVSID
jgi:hypothetical protein